MRRLLIRILYNKTNNMKKELNTLPTIRSFFFSKNSDLLYEVEVAGPPLVLALGNINGGGI